MSEPDRKFFEENGYLGPFKVYEPEVARRMLKDIRRKNADRSKALFDNECNYDRHFDIDELSRHISNEVIVRKLQSILGDNLICWRSEFFPKFPGAKGTEWHQVERFQYTTGAPQLQPLNGNAGDIVSELTVWTTFTESNEANGCLKFLPGSQRKKYYDESKTPSRGRTENYSSVEAETSFFGYNFSDFKIDPDWSPDESKAASMIMQPGEAVIFTAKCVHGSFPNTTKDQTRFAISTRYVTTDTLVYPSQQRFREHGGDFDLSNYGTVLVAGKNDYRHNKLRETNNHGQPFAEPWAPLNQRVLVGV
jgi:non-heme Fe2+,alpha-ketoglutarate-dependent halogenase